MKTFLRYALAAAILASEASLAAPDDSVPRVLKGGFASFETPRPASVDDWEHHKPRLRAKLWKLLGVSPPTFTPKATIDRREVFDGYVREHVRFDNAVDDTVYGYLLIPTGVSGPRPAILYNHYHAGRFAQGKEELFIHAFAEWGGNKTLVTGPALVRAGYVVFCIDVYGFGERQHQSPDGQWHDGLDTQMSLVNVFALEGRTFWGMVVCDDMLALSYLASRPEVAPERIAAMGMSMGSTRTWWLAAMDDRVKVAVSVACLSRLQNLIVTGGANCIAYMTVPGLLRERIDAESVVGLIAPRAHLTLTGDRDLGSPTSGVRTINSFQEHLYKLYGKGENFRGILYPGVGHEYTPAMWEETMQWLKKHL